MHRPAVHGIIVDTGRMRAFFRLLFRLVAGKFQKARQCFFVDKRPAVFLYLYAVVDLLGKHLGGIRLQVCFDLLFFFRRCL